MSLRYSTRGGTWLKAAGLMWPDTTCAARSDKRRKSKSHRYIEHLSALSLLGSH